MTTIAAEHAVQETRWVTVRNAREAGFFR